MLALVARQLALGAAGAIVLAGSVLSAKTDTTRIFGDWTTSCWTSEKRCAAETDGYGPAPRREKRVTMSMSRRNAADAEWDLSLRLHNVRPAAGSALAFRVDTGEAVRFAPRGGYTLASSGRRARLKDPDGLAKLAPLLPAGRTLQVSFTGRRGEPLEADVSLAGLTAALNWINERQGRTADSPLLAARPKDGKAPARPETAEQDRKPAAAKPPRQEPKQAETPAPKHEPAKTVGPKAESANTPPVPRKMAEGPRQDAAPGATQGAEGAQLPGAASLPDALLDRHFRISECDPLSGGPLSPNGAIQAELGEGKTLYIIPCFAGAYNVAYRLYLVRNDEIDKARTLYFANFSETLGWYGSDTLINASFDPESKTLASFGKGRGLGDCGNAARYRWDGFDFRMIDYRAWDQCDGSRRPDQWPIVYEAAEK
jgi:hypothetical protein